MVALAILLAIVMAVYEDMHRENDPTFIRFVIPVVAGLVTWNALIGALVLVLFFTVSDPSYNWARDREIFYSRHLKFRDVLGGRAGLYDLWNGRVVLMIEIFILVVLISELLT